jgi:hypothetical protein
MVKSTASQRTERFPFAALLQNEAAFEEEEASAAA